MIYASNQINFIHSKTINIKNDKTYSALILSAEVLSLIFFN